MVTAGTTRKRTSPTLHYRKMLELAKEMGCQMEASREDRSILRGFCPFHEGNSLRNSRTLRIDAKTGKFNCEFCSASGTPIAFFAKIWGVNAHDTYNLISAATGPVTAERPRFPPQPEGEGREGGQARNYPWLNSAVMTRATKFYERQLYTNFPPLNTLARLGVEPRDAARAGIGYCPGEGLREFLLEETDATPGELEDNPLWNEETGLETLAGRITLSDRDHTGATMWITSILPEESRNGASWRPERPHNYGITGRKPFLFGQYSATSQTPWAIFTDDPRLYVVAASQGLPAMLMTQYRQPGEDLKNRCRRAAEALNNRRMHSLSMVMHDREASGMIHGFLKNLSRAPEITVHGRAAIMENLSPHTRDISRLREAHGNAAAQDGPEPGPQANMPYEPGQHEPNQHKPGQHEPYELETPTQEAAG